MSDPLLFVGGSYDDVSKAYKASNWEINPGTWYYQGHHSLAKEHIRSTLGVSDKEAPAICMSFDDHEKTLSWGPFKEAGAYRLTQRSFLWEGRLSEAWAMDVADVLKFKDEQGQAKYVRL